MNYNFSFENKNVKDFIKVNKSSVYTKQIGWGFSDLKWVESNQEDILSKVEQVSQGSSYVQDDENYITINGDKWDEERCDEGFVTKFTYINSSIFNVDLAPDDYKVIVTFATKKPVDVIIEGIFKRPVEEEENGDGVKKTYIISLIDEQLNLLFTGGEVRVSAIEILALPKRSAGDAPRIYIASDSTVMSYGEEYMPLGGWGQMLENYFDKAIKINNGAIGGRSSKSFIIEGRLDRILNKIRPKDYLFIQWGHNDATAVRPARYVSTRNFEEWIQKYVDGAKQRGAIPVLVTPVPQRILKDGKFAISFAGYRTVMLKMSAEQNICLLDLGKAGAEFLNDFGFEESKAIFLFVPAGLYKAYPNGSTDRTHYQIYGANVMAGLLSELVKRAENDPTGDISRLSKYLKEKEIPEELPETPIDFKVVKISSSNVTMSWKESDKADLYYIYRKGLNGRYVRCGVSAFTTYIDTNCEESAQYSYKVMAKNDLGNSPFSNELVVETKSTNMKYLFTGEAKEGYTHVDFSLNFDKDLGYGFSPVKDNIFVVETANGDYSVKIVTDREQKIFDMQTVDGKLNIGASLNAVSIEITLIALAPTALRYYELNINSNPPTVVLTWTASEDVKEYCIYRKKNDEAYVRLYQTNDTTYYEESASLGDVYSYYVTGVTEQDNETTSTNEVIIKMIKE